MPYNPSTGQYVPLTAAQKAQITNYAAGVLRRDPAIDNKALGLKIGQRSGVYIDNYDALVVYNLINDAKAENAAGAAATANPNQPPSTINIPTVFDDPGDTGRYVTWFVVTVTDPVTGETQTSDAVSVDNSPPSASDLRDAVSANPTAFIGVKYTVSRSGQSIPNATYDVIILSISHAR